jgi:hypothetical protein
MGFAGCFDLCVFHRHPVLDQAQRRDLKAVARTIGGTHMNTRNQNGLWIAVCLAAAAVFSLSCSLSALQGKQPDPTLTALYQAVKSTVTAHALKGDSANEDIATAQARATSTSLVVAARQTESASGRTQGDLATATVSAPIVAELQVYGVDPSDGRVGWIHDPLTLFVEGYQQMDFGNDYMQVTARDFVLASDVTWDTQYGTNSCGFMFRSDGNQNKPNQYMVIASRFALGRVVFTAVMDGELNNMHDFYPKDEDRSFSWENGSTNRIAIIARGPRIEIYTNNVRIGEILTTDPPKPFKPPVAPIKPSNVNDQSAMNDYLKQMDEYEEIVQQLQSNYQVALKNNSENPAIFDDGFLGMLVLSESGRTTCTFTNTWLWLIGE